MLKYHKRKLLKHLEMADNESFFQLLWAANMLQESTPATGLRYLDRTTVPDKAIGARLGQAEAIAKWELETLANEVLTTKELTGPGARRLNHTAYGNVVVAINRIRKIENAEFRIGGHREDVLTEMMRIANRQFPWQRGFANMAGLYRNIFVYGQGVCADVFSRKHGVSIAEFTKTAFILHSWFMSRPAFRKMKTYEFIGVTEEQLRATMAPLVRHHSDLARNAAQERRSMINTAYKPSVFRQYPIANFGKETPRLRAPLPQLILERMTSGIFYDIADGGHAVREDYGRRFEAYCIELGEGSLPEIRWQPERLYRVSRKQQFLTPDVLCSVDGRGLCAIECKATRMSLDAMYGKDPTQDRGFQDMVKAVKQLWRFFAHVRMGHFEFDNDPQAPGIVLTLDNLFSLATGLIGEVVARAKQEIMKEMDFVQEADMRPIIFTPVQNLERVLGRATTSSFTELMGLAGQDENRGFMLEYVHERTASYNKNVDNPYPFKDRVNEVVPWWGIFERVDGH